MILQVIEVIELWGLCLLYATGMLLRVAHVFYSFFVLS